MNCPFTVIELRVIYLILSLFKLFKLSELSFTYHGPTCALSFHTFHFFKKQLWSFVNNLKSKLKWNYQFCSKEHELETLRLFQKSNNEMIFALHENLLWWRLSFRQIFFNFDRPWLYFKMVKKNGYLYLLLFIF